MTRKSRQSEPEQSPEEIHDVEIVQNSVITAHQAMGIVPQGSEIIPNTQNALAVLQNHPLFNGNIWFDEFHQKYFTTYDLDDNFGKTIREWDNEDDIRLSIFMQRALQINRMSDDTVNKAMRVHAKNHVKNEPRDWMNSLVWDGIPRIETFLINCAGSKDNEYSRAVSRNFFISMVARIYSPGCKVDTMPILEGPQGKLKSTLLSTIGGKWHTEASYDLYSKDFLQCLQGKMIIEFADLSGLTKHEVNTIKDILVRRIDYFRLPYARIPQSFPRMSVFSGTTNNSTYLKDSTGARRFWPIRIGKIDIGRAKSERDQLFAEAVYIFKSEKPLEDVDRVMSSWWNMPAETIDEQEERREIDPWEQLIYKFIENKNECSTHEIMKDCLYIEPNKQDRYAEMRIGNILRLLKWERNRKRIGTSLKWIYTPPIQLIETPNEQDNINWED